MVQLCMGRRICWLPALDKKRRLKNAAKIRKLPWTWVRQVPLEPLNDTESETISSSCLLCILDVQKDRNNFLLICLPIPED
ncbi:unnamed protein product [Urochloa humidicola]